VLARCFHRHTAETHPRCFNRVTGQRLEKWEPKPHWLEDQRIGFLDIETSNLAANFGIIFSWYIKPLGSDRYDKYVLSPDEILRHQYDKESMRVLCEKLRKYDVIVGYYSKRFDIPFLRSHCLKFGWDFPVYGELCHIDLFDTVKRKLRLHRNRLATACEYLGIEGKTPIDFSCWVKALSGHKPSLRYIAIHNKADVDILERLYYKIKPHVRFTRTSI
jgi:uncharacterized protein YprB with RNaseH-like and TPR domain